jgi:hypothetical protein
MEWPSFYSIKNETSGAADLYRCAEGLAHWLTPTAGPGFAASMLTLYDGATPFGTALFYLSSWKKSRTMIQCAKPAVDSLTALEGISSAYRCGGRSL